MAADIGLIGLGTMGAALALNIAEKGFPIAVFNRTAGVADKFADEAGDLAARITATDSLEALVQAIRPPRAIILMVPAGDPVDQMIAAAPPAPRQGRSHHRRRQRQLPRHPPPGGGGGEVGRALPRHRRLRRRGRRPPRSIDHGRRPEGGLGPRRADPRGHRGEIRRHALRHLDGNRRRRPLRQDRPQRHRIRRHADDRRGLRADARRARAGAGGDCRDLRALERRTAQVLPRRDHRQGLRRDRPRDRRANGRGHPRPRRPEGHRPLDGDRSPDARRTGNRDRGRRSRPQHFSARRRAQGRRRDLPDPAEPHPRRRRGGLAPRGGAPRRQDRLLRPRLRPPRHRLEGVRLGSASRRDRQGLARRLHHPLGDARRHGPGARGEARRRTSCSRPPSPRG